MSDPGVAAERTDLAWTRTALSFVAVALLGARLRGPVVAIVPVLTGAFAASAPLRRRAGAATTLGVLAVGAAITALVVAVV